MQYKLEGGDDQLFAQQQYYHEQANLKASHLDSPAEHWASNFSTGQMLQPRAL